MNLLALSIAHVPVDDFVGMIVSLCLCAYLAYALARAEKI